MRGEGARGRGAEPAGEAGGGAQERILRRAVAAVAQGEDERLERGDAAADEEIVRGDGDEEQRAALAGDGERGPQEVRQRHQEAEGDERPAQPEARDDGAAAERAGDGGGDADVLVDQADLGVGEAEPEQERRRHGGGDEVAQSIAGDEGEQAERARAGEPIGERLDDRRAQRRRRRDGGGLGRDQRGDDADEEQRGRELIDAAERQVIGGDQRQPAGDQHGGAIAEDVDGGAGGALVGREEIGAIGVGDDVLAGGAQGDTDGERGEGQRRGARRGGAERDERGAERELEQDDPAAATPAEGRTIAIDERRPQELERVGQRDGGEEPDAGERDPGLRQPRRQRRRRQHVRQPGGEPEREQHEHARPRKDHRKNLQGDQEIRRKTKHHFELSVSPDLPGDLFLACRRVYHLVDKV